MPAGDRDRLEHLCRYVLRPPIAQERLELTADGKVLLRLRRTWHDGTRAVRLPVDLPQPAPARAPGWLPGLLPGCAGAHDPCELH